MTHALAKSPSAQPLGRRRGSACGSGPATRIAAIAAMALLTVGNSARADVTGRTFRSPTDNIHCYANADRDYAHIRCEIYQHKWNAPRGSCGRQRTAILDMSRRGRPHFICPNDTIPPDRTLRYGSRWRLGPFRCTMRHTGLTCRNRASHGWFLSRAAYRLF